MHLSLVIPSYNCRGLIGATIAAALEGLAATPGGFELIVSDDGSSDGTAELAQALGLERVRVLASPRNQGKGAAVRAGILAARGELVVFTDVDLAYPVGEIAKITAALAVADVAIATRVAAQSRFVMSPRFFRYLYTRHAASRAFNRLVNAVFRLEVEDTQAGLKGFRRDAAQRIFALQALDSFTFDVEVLLIARRLGLVVSEVPILYRYDSEPTTVDFLSDSVGALRDLWRIHRRDRAGGYRGILTK